MEFQEASSASVLRPGLLEIVTFGLRLMTIERQISRQKELEMHRL